MKFSGLLKQLNNIKFRNGKFKQEIDSLRQITDNILSLYRLRLNRLIRRHNLLKSVAQDFSKVNDDFCRKLEIILKQEKK